MHASLLSLSLSLAWSFAPGPPAPRDWPHFLGPDRTGAVGAVESSFEWGEDGPTVAWRLAIGPGYGGVAVVDGSVYLLDREEGERDVLRVVALEDGKELWSDGYAAPGRLSFKGSRTVPSVQEGYVVTLGGFGHVASFSLETHELDWLVDLQEDFGGELPTFGYSAAPLVHDGLVIVPALGEDIGLMAIELESGAALWTTPGVGRSHSTPTLVHLNGGTQVVFISAIDRASGDDEAAPSRLTALDPGSGEVLWQHELLLCRLPIPGPVQIDDEHLFLTGGYRAGSTLLRIGGGDEPTFEEVFRIGRGSQVHTPILHGGHLYLLANENWNYGRRLQEEGGLMCLALDGTERWRTGADPFFGRGNAILAGEHLLLQDGFDGTLRVAQASPEGYRQVAQAPIFGEPEERDGQMWAPMALSGKRLLMRSQEELVCLEL